MALSDKLRDRVAPHLEDGEQIRAVFLAQTGPNPTYLLVIILFVFTAVLIFFMRHFVIVVTDRRVAVFSVSRWKVGEPRKLVASFPADTWLGEPSGLWAKVEVGGVRYWVNRRFHDEIRSLAKPLVVTSS